MTYVAAIVSKTHPGTVALGTGADHCDGLSHLTPTEARALAADLEQAAFEIERQVPPPCDTCGKRPRAPGFVHSCAECAAERVADNQHDAEYQ